MTDSVQWLNQSDYSICISILAEFYQWQLDSICAQKQSGAGRLLREK